MPMRYLYKWAQGQKSKGHSLCLAALFKILLLSASCW